MGPRSLGLYILALGLKGLAASLRNPSGLREHMWVPVTRVTQQLPTQAPSFLRWPPPVLPPRTSSLREDTLVDSSAPRREKFATNAQGLELLQLTVGEGRGDGERDKMSRGHSVLEARGGNPFQMDTVCVTCDKHYRKRNGNWKSVSASLGGPPGTFVGFTFEKPSLRRPWERAAPAA